MSSPQPGRAWITLAGHGISGAIVTAVLAMYGSIFLDSVLRVTYFPPAPVISLGLGAFVGACLGVFSGWRREQRDRQMTKSASLRGLHATDGNKDIVDELRSLHGPHGPKHEVWAENTSQRIIDGNRFVVADLCHRDRDDGRPANIRTIASLRLEQTEVPAFELCRRSVARDGIRRLYGLFGLRAIKPDAPAAFYENYQLFGDAAAQRLFEGKLGTVFAKAAGWEIRCKGRVISVSWKYKKIPANKLDSFLDKAEKICHLIQEEVR